MRKAFWLWIMACFVLFLSSVAFAGDQVIVIFEGSTTWVERDNIVMQNGGMVVKHLGIIDGAAVRLPRGKPDKARRAICEHPEVVGVEDDNVRNACAQTLPWGIDRIDAESGKRSGAGTAVKVAVLDTGIDLDHPDLAVNIKGEYNATGRGSNANDNNGHGTHCAGIIAALDNTIGVVGVAPEAHLYAVKVLDNSGRGYDSWIIAGLDWCIANGVQVASMSFGGYSDNPALHGAITNAYDNGIVLVAAAGNGSTSALHYPSAYAETIGVSATDSTDNFASFSNYGDYIDFAAPGVGILSTYKGGNYTELNGTSMSCPHVAGAAALFLEDHPGTPPADVLYKLPAEDIGLLATQQGKGLIDAQGASKVWSEPLGIATNPGTISPRKACLAVDSLGTLHCVWQQTDSLVPLVKNLYYSNLDSGDSWASPLLISTSNPGGDLGLIDHPHMAVDSADDIHVVWGGYDAAGVWQVWYRKCESGSWLSCLQVTSGADHSFWPDLAVDSMGRIHVVFVTLLSVYSSNSHEIFYTYSDDGIDWSIVPSNVSASTAPNSWGPSIALDSDGVLHVAWTEEVLLGSYDILYRNFDGMSWSASVNLSNNDGLSYQPDIVAGDDGTMLVAWMDATGGIWYPMYSYYNGSVWSGATDIAAPEPNLSLDLNVGYNGGEFYAAWAHSCSCEACGILFASFDGLSWTAPTSLSTGGANRLHTTGGGMTVEGSGAIHVVFSERTLGELWYATRR